MLARLILLLIFVLPVVIATLWFSDNPGTVQIEWLGWRVETNMPLLLVSLLFLFTALFSLFQFSASLMDLPAKLGHSRKAKGKEKGMAALLAALDAVATGDIGEGRRLGAEAAKLLGSSALAARLDRLMPRPLTPPAEDLKQDAGKMRGGASIRKEPASKLPTTVTAAPVPSARTEVVQEEDPNVFAEKVRVGAWDEALAVVEKAVVAGRLRPQTAARRRAAVLEAQAVGETNPEAALRLARQSMNADPEFLAAALHVVRLDAAAGRRDEAEATLAAAWRRTPARPLLALCRDLWKDDDPQSRLRRMESLAEANPSHPETHLAVGEAAVAAERWGVARRHLVAAVKASPDALGYRLMAEVEERETGGATSAAEIWRRKEHEAPPAPGWHCHDCKATQPEWSIVCPSCGAVATIDWA